ncbi:MAG: PQQ-binding-like beta-propeller repeat protein [Verrucomicrobia bacterium]|nr:PQQ-binding-like beta-propeller repeat protein [Verrucomicrobiota bacterium]
MTSNKLVLSLVSSVLFACTAVPAADAKAVAKLGVVKPLRQTTALISNERAPVIIAPASGAGRMAAETLRSALAKRLGVESSLISKLADAKPGQQTAIALGNMLDNELLTRLYWSRYTYEDGQFPSPDGYTVHTVFDPHHWGGGQDVIVLGASRPEQLGRAVERFLGLLQGEGSSTVLPHTVIVEPAKKLTTAARRSLAKPVDPSFTAFRINAEQYLKTGDETHARLAIAALDIMVETYCKNPKRHMPWPEETSSGEIFAAWDAFEECPLITPEKRRDYLEAFLAWSRDLTHCSYEYRAIDEKFTVTWNHTTFALLGLYFAGRYFDRHYDLAEAKEWLRKSRLGFAAQARSWKPQEDADSYIVHTMEHVIQFSLADWDMRFFENGVMKRYADYVVGCGDTRQLPAGFGDSGYGMAPTMAKVALPVAYWWTRDGGYRWLLEHMHGGGWENAYWTDTEPRAPERFVGLNVFPMDRQIYDDTQRRPTYNEAFERADVPFEEAWDKISFRENWEPDGQYLLLDGLGRGKHLHFDTGSIATFVQDGERWLIDHDYLVRNTTEHSMLSVLRDGRCTKLVPSLAGLAASGDLPGMAATRTYVKSYNSVDWDRRVLWSKGAWFLVQDTITAREDGNYDLDLTWKTIDRGDQQVNERGQFAARRSGAKDSSDLAVVDDSQASNGKAVVLSSPAARLIFGAELPQGEYQVSVIGYGMGTSSDSLFVSLDGGTPMTVGVPVERYASSVSARIMRCRVTSDGPHTVEIKLREAPPVRIDRIEFRRDGAPAIVIEAEQAPSARPKSASKPVVSALHIDPALPVRAWVTDHVRQGISVPVSVLHQRQSARLKAGENATFCSLVYATGPKHPSEFNTEMLRPTAHRVKDVVAGFGPDQAGRWECDADAWLVKGGTISLIAARSVSLGETRLAFEPAANMSIDASGGKMTLIASRPTCVTARGGATANGQQRLELPAGTHTVTVNGLDVAAIRDADNPVRADVRRGKSADKSVRVTAAKPLWSVELAKNSPVFRITPADLDGDSQPELLVACGSAGHAVSGSGKLLWSHSTGGVVRDVSLARFGKNGPPTALVSSADTYLHQLDPTGHLKRKDRMIGIYFNQDHGDRPWGLYCTRGVDQDGDGADDMLVTTLASMEAQGLSPDAKKLWRTLSAYHGCMEMAVEDLDRDGKPEIVIANKYGAVFVLRPDGSRLMASNTSIGDVTFGLGDLNGDGKKEIVHGSSTGDLIAVTLANKTLWRFDNYGYPVERIRCADLNGDGQPEVLIASGTGYLYCLDAAGKLIWQRRLGLAVHDLALTDGFIIAGTEDGEVHALDHAGKPKWSRYVGASVTKLAAIQMADRPVVVAGLADGRLVALPMK